MPIIYTYPTATPTSEDFLIISDVSETDPVNATRKCTIQSVVNLIGALVPGGGTVTSVATANNLGASCGITFAASPNPITTTGTITTSFAGTIGDILYADTATSLNRLPASNLNYVLTSGGPGVAPSWAAAPVLSVSAIAPGTSTGTPVVVTPTTGAVTIKSMKFNGAANVGHVPDASAAAAGSYLKNDGSWATPPDTTYSAMDTTTLGLGKLRYARGLTPAAQPQSIDANRTYGITDNAVNQLVVNVPWVDTNTTYSMSAATDGSNVDLSLDPSTGAGTTIQFTAGANMTITQSGGNNITFAAGSSGATSNGWDVLNFAQGETMSANATILYFYQVVVPEPFTANKAKLYVTVASGSSTFAVSIYDGLLSNLATTTKLGDGTVNPGGTGIVEVPLTEVSAGNLDLTAGQNIILGFAQSIGDKMLCINSRIADSNLAISSVTALPFPSTLSSLEEPTASALRPCCVLYK